MSAREELSDAQKTWPEYQQPAVTSVLISIPVVVRSKHGRNTTTHAVTKNLQYTLCLSRRIQNWWEVVNEPIECPRCLEILARETS